MQQKIGKLTRREMVEKLIAGMAAGLTFPLIAAAHPIHQHLKDAATLDRADAAAKTASWKPLFLTSQQNETLVPLSESMVPGSANANVNHFIDLLLSVDSMESQRKFAASLAAIDGEAQSRFQRGFHQLTAMETNELLSAFSTQGEQKKHFDDIKEWITIAYYSSEDGMRELGWTENRAYKVFPGCEQAG